ncbi:MAG: hypothetical protein IKO15_07975 [Clostridiales bacterium]|nr:hypothetical protein [Clostridiales bacterium]
MKCKRKAFNTLKDNSGETIAEVLVAFILLTIMLLIYSQGIALATNSEMKADKSRTGADKAMKQVQDDIADNDESHRTENYRVPVYLDTRIIHKTYEFSVDGKTYSYVYYEPYEID